MINPDSLKKALKQVDDDIKRAKAGPKLWGAYSASSNTRRVEK